MEKRLIIALDVPDVHQAMKLVSSLKNEVETFKIGHWLMADHDINDLISLIRDEGKEIFWDAKIYDIGETVSHGIMRAGYRGMKYVTVHGDKEIMQMATRPHIKHSFPNLEVLAVTVLSSMNQLSLRQMGYACSLEDLIAFRIHHAIETQCAGVVMAPSDLPILKSIGLPQNFKIITPGIRLENQSMNEHSRSGTPNFAINNSATHIVVGRPIIHADDPLKATIEIIEDMNS